MFAKFSKKLKPKDVYQVFMDKFETIHEEYQEGDDRDGPSTNCILNLNEANHNEISKNIKSFLEENKEWKGSKIILSVSTYAGDEYEGSSSTITFYCDREQLIEALNKVFPKEPRADEETSFKP